MASITSEIASSSSLPKREYDVFLSFRGDDTRNNFTDHLYAALDRKGIWTFRDDERLERGKPISELFNAIEKSKFAIIVLSENYASSSWCLDELVKIIETKLTVLPVFYGVDPSDVRHVRGRFAFDLAKHEERGKNKEKLQSWRTALTQVANLRGWDTRNEKESIIIEEIARKLIDDLHYSYSGDHEDLVGMQSRVKEMENLCLSMGFNDVHFIGIWGMGGIGKTTIAQVLYDTIHNHFDGSSFLANVREKSGNGGLVTLQKQLLSDVLSEKNIDISDVQRGINLIRHRLCHKRVLVILDDVDQDKQLEALAGKQSWFGRGSMIIIITRGQHLLVKHEVAKEKIYNVNKLNDDEALKLFSLKAFKQDNPLEGYEVLSKKFINYAQGLPLALKVLGSSVICRNLDEWESVLGRLKETPEKEILDVLQISFNCLKTTEKEIFLDIACFFKGMTKYRVTSILQTLNYKPNIEIDELVDKSLITISTGTLWMHDLLQELGKEIVRRESPKELGERSRLWVKEDVLHVLKYNTGTKKVEGIFINTPSKEEDLNVEEKVEDLNAKTFSEMRHLRLLKICNVGLPQGLNSLSSDLRLMDWPKYPLKSMPKNFNPDKLVELFMPRSSIKQLWEGNWSLEWLRIINLSDSKELIMTLDFARVPNLEELILKGCTKLSKIHASLGDLKHLILLDLNGCTCLKSLPCKINLESLEIFRLSSCSKLKNFPEIVGNMSRLLELYLDGTAIEDLPLSMEQLIGLIKLDLTNCKKLSSLPRVIYSLTSLNTLTLSGCSKLHKMEENLGNLEGLEELDVSGTAIREPPSSIFCLKNLKILSFQGCNGLSPKSWSWKNLLMRKTQDLMVLVLPSVSGLTTLTRLNIRNCNLQAIPSDIGYLSSLQELDLSENNFVCLPESMNQLSNLETFWVENCKSLQLLPVLQSYTKTGVWANGCTSLETLLPLKIQHDIYLRLLNCFQLVENQGHRDLFTTMLREYFQEFCYRESIEKKRFDLVIPGSEVLNWFRHQSVGASINLEVPSYLLKQVRGIAFCAVFGPYQHRPPKKRRGPHDSSAVCNLKTNGHETGYYMTFSEEIEIVESDHRWFMYLLPNYISNDYFQKILLQIADGSSCQLEIDFKLKDYNKPETEIKDMLEIKKCGAHMVFEEEMEDLIRSMGQSECSSSIIPYNEGVDIDHFEEDIKIKRSRDDENGGSGEGSSPHIPHPKTKRVRPSDAE